MQGVQRTVLTRAFAKRVATAAAAAVVACSILFVDRADYGRYVADGLPALLTVAAGFFILSYVALCLGAVVAAWLTGGEDPDRHG